MGLDVVGFLVGGWKGEGRGLWSDPPFFFSDSLVFTPDSGGRPLLEIRQVTVDSGGRASHSEVGYLICRPDGEVVIVIAEPSGITEVLVGGVRGVGDGCGGCLEVSSVEIGHAPGTDAVTAVRRRYSVDGDELVAEVAIAVGGEELSEHTRSVLHRSSHA